MTTGAIPAGVALGTDNKIRRHRFEKEQCATASVHEGVAAVVEVRLGEPQIDEGAGAKVDGVGTLPGGVDQTARRMHIRA